MPAIKTMPKNSCDKSKEDDNSSKIHLKRQRPLCQRLTPMTDFTRDGEMKQSKDSLPILHSGLAVSSSDPYGIIRIRDENLGHGG